LLFVSHVREAGAPARGDDDASDLADETLRVAREAARTTLAAARAEAERIRAAAKEERARLRAEVEQFEGELRAMEGEIAGLVQQVAAIEARRDNSTVGEPPRQAQAVRPQVVRPAHEILVVEPEERVTTAPSALSEPTQRAREWPVAVEAVLPIVAVVVLLTVVLGLWG
jgi:hypothetical protein